MALGLSIDGRVSDRGLATGAVVWAVLVTAWSLFVGGFIASLFTTGENKFEGVVYGLIVWAVVFAMIVGLLAAGVRAGFGAMVGVANTTGSAAAANGNWEDLARRNGATDADIARARADMSTAPASIRDAVNDPATRQAAEDARHPRRLVLGPGDRAGHAGRRRRRVRRVGAHVPVGDGRWRCRPRDPAECRRGPDLGRPAGANRTAPSPRHFQPGQRAGAAAELVRLDAQALQHRHVEVAQRRRLCRVEGQVLAVLEAAAGEQDRQVLHRVRWRRPGCC